jgi:hypothetical protein
MKFKDLGIDQEFEFDHKDLVVGCLQMAHGPWRKVSNRKYIRADGSEASSYCVGSINIKVAPGKKCLGRYGW